VVEHGLHWGKQIRATYVTRLLRDNLFLFVVRLDWWMQLIDVRNALPGAPRSVYFVRGRTPGLGNSKEVGRVAARVFIVLISQEWAESQVAN